MAQDVAEQIIALLRSAHGELSIADPPMPWQALPAELIVTAHPDGSVTRRGISKYADTNATSLLTKAFDVARAQGNALVIWPDGYQPQSIVVRLMLEPASLIPAVGGAQSIVAPQYVVFVTSYPTVSPALPRLNNPNPQYPSSASYDQVSGSVLLQFVVDTLGKAERSTIRDVWPSDKPRELGRYYDDFVHSVAKVLPSWRFYPARVGSCPVNQLVQLPLRFATPGYRD